MCLAAFSLHLNDPVPLIILSNRDEFHRRPTQALHWWQAGKGEGEGEGKGDSKPLLGGRDLQAGGTWMGVNHRLRWGFILNRPPVPEKAGQKMRTRGMLVPEWLDSELDAEAFLQEMQGRMHLYAPFCLVIGDLSGVACCCLSSLSGKIYRYEEGTHAFSNCEPDMDWGKTRTLRRELAGLYGECGLVVDAGSEQRLLALMAAADGAKKSRTGAVERTEPATFSEHKFICTPNYGTGCSTLLRADNRGSVRVVEQRWHPDGSSGECNRVAFQGESSLSATGLPSPS